MQFLRQLFDGNEHDIARYRKVVDKINALEPSMEKLTDEQLAAKPTEFKERIAKSIEEESKKYGGEWDELGREDKRRVTDAALDPLVDEAFADVREAARRTLKLRPINDQLIGGKD